jgi:hypothetical protein
MAEKSVKPSKTKREIEALSQRVKDSRLTFKDLIIPLSILLILVILGIFLFIPMVQTAMSSRAQFSSLKNREKELQKIEEKLQDIDEVQLQTDLINSKIVIPQSLRVASFISYIDELAREKNLYSQLLTAGDSQTSVIRRGQGDNERRTYFGVSSPLTYEGDLSNVLSFLDNLHEASPYVISMRGVSLARTTGDQWKVSLSVMGYYVPESTLEIDPYVSFEIYTEYQRIIEMFAEKAEQLK